jgi:hypothetical protein
MHDIKSQKHATSIRTGKKSCARPDLGYPELSVLNQSATGAFHARDHSFRYNYHLKQLTQSKVLWISHFRPISSGVQQVSRIRRINNTRQPIESERALETAIVIERRGQSSWAASE